MPAILCLPSEAVLDPFSFLITYPKINLSSGEAVRNFYYGSSQRAPEHYNFNTTGTGQADTPHNLDFQIKLQNFSKCQLVLLIAFGAEVED